MVYSPPFIWLKVIFWGSLHHFKPTEITPITSSVCLAYSLQNNIQFARIYSIELATNTAPYLLKLESL